MMNFSLEEVEFAIRKLGMWIYILPELLLFMIDIYLPIHYGVYLSSYQFCLVVIDLKTYVYWSFCLTKGEIFIDSSGTNGNFTNYARGD